MTVGLVLVGLLLAGCLESPPGNLDGGRAVDAFACTGACCGSPAGG